MPGAGAVVTLDLLLPLSSGRPSSTGTCLRGCSAVCQSAIWIIVICASAVCCQAGTVTQELAPSCCWECDPRLQGFETARRMQIRTRRSNKTDGRPDTLLRLLFTSLVFSCYRRGFSTDPYHCTHETGVCIIHILEIRGQAAQLHKQYSCNLSDKPIGV